MIDIKELAKVGNLTLRDGTKIKFETNEFYPLVLNINDGDEFHFWLEKGDGLKYDGYDKKVNWVEDDSAK